MKKILMMCAVALGMAGVSVALGADYTTSRVISVNIRGGNDADAATDSAGLVAVPANAWNNYKTINQDYSGVTWDGSAAVTLDPNWTVRLSGGGSYWWVMSGIESILRYYIDDNASNHAKMIFANLPFDCYDVYVYMAADSSAKFSPVSTIIDGETTSYTCGSDGIAFEGTAAWGQSQQLKSKAGTNVIIIKNQTAANITIDGGTRGVTRGAIAAVQLVEAKASTTYKATMSANTKWSALKWSPTPPAEGFEAGALLDITVTGSPTLTFDSILSLNCKCVIHGTPQIRLDDALYEDGCWQTDFAAFSLLTTDAVTYAPLKEDYVGAYGKTSAAFTLRAQNKEVVSINFAGGNNSEGYSPEDYIVKGSGYVGLAPVQGDTWVNLTNRWYGRVTKIIPPVVATKDGATKIDRSTIAGTCTAQNTYRWDTATDAFLKGYLDDGGDHALVTVTNIPYSSYDVIVYRATDSGGYKFAEVTLNGTAYTYDSANPTVAKEGTGKWGQSQNKTAVYGTNALRIRNIKSSTLTIDGGVKANGARGCIAGIQIVCTGDIQKEHDYTATISGDAAFGYISWKEGVFQEGVLTTATITIDDSSTDEVAITFENSALVLKSLTIISKRDVRLVASERLANVASIDVSQCSGKVTYAMPVMALESSTNEDIFYAGGAGTENVRVAIGHNGGVLNLIGGTYHLIPSVSAMQTAVNMADVVVDYGRISETTYYDFAIGRATYTLTGVTQAMAPSLRTSQGGSGRESVLTLKDDALLEVTGSVNEDSNRNSILLGHWNGPSTLTLTNNATFMSTNAQVLVGMTGNTQTINIEGGTFKVKGVKASSNAKGTNTLNLNGGELVLGDVGISSYGTTKIVVSVGGDAKITSLEETRITQPLMIDSGKTLTIDATKGDVILFGTLVNNGTIKVIGGNLIIVGTENLGTCVVEGTGKVLVGYTVTINDCGKFKIPVGKEWDEVLLFDANGNRVVITDHDENYVYFDWKITGDACWWDYEFEGNVNNIGTDGVALSWDYPHPYQDNEYVTDEKTGEKSLRIPSRPYRSVGSWPSTTTFVMYGTMVNSNKTYQIGFGSTYIGSKYTIFLAMDDASKDTVNLCLSYGKNAPTVLWTMTVPDAQTSKHLYAFMMKNDGVGNSVVDIYLDGQLVYTYTHEGLLSLGNGFQIGNGHGGVVAGYNRPSPNDPAILDWLRVYNLELSEEVMKKYARMYPFVPKAPTISPVSGTTFDTSLTVSMASDYSGVTIHYTLNGSEPAVESPAYTKKFRIYERTVVKAVAFLPDGTASKMAVAEYATGRCDDPVISPPDGTVFERSGLSVSIRRTAEDGVLRYTIDGSDPTEESPEYTGPFTIDESTVVKAKAFGDQYFDSNIVTATLTRVWVKLATPVITADETFTGTKNKVVMSCANEGATIYYTLDGSEPTTASLVYSKPFCVTEGCTIKAKAVQYDYTDSEVAEKEITREWGIGQTMGKPDHSFETSGDAGFVRVVDETAALGESMQSGEIKNSQTSILSTVVVGPGKLSFKWKTSCEYDEELHEWDHAEFVLDGDILEVLDGETNWQSVSCDITGDGPHTVIWRYVKDGSEFEGEDCLWVSEYVWESDYVTTQTTGVPVPYLWMEEKCSDVVDEFESYEKVAKQKALNKRLTVEQCYVAGVDPESLTQDFTTTISMEGGFPTVTWDPDLGVLREYKVWGRESLMSGDWQYPTNSTHRFFKVTVEMK